jgi:hypothetical protein
MRRAGRRPKWTSITRVTFEPLPDSPRTTDHGADWTVPALISAHSELAHGVGGGFRSAKVDRWCQ